MKTKLKQESVPFNNVAYANKINGELIEGKEINALFLAHGYIDAYLREWLYIAGKVSKDRIKKNIIDEVGKISFKNIILIHAILGNIDAVLYNKLCTINDLRNDLAHELIRVDVRDKKNKEKIKASTEQAIKICDEIFNLYQQHLDTKTKEIKKLKII